MGAARDHIAHLHIDDVADDELMQLGFTRVRITTEHRALALLPDRILFQLVAIQDFKVDRIIEVVAVIGDLVREIGNLRFQGGTTICLGVG